jgi:hypothetical protein
MPRPNLGGTRLDAAARLALALIAMHALVALVHGVTHLELGIGLSPWQTGFVGVVIGAAPLVAAAFLWMGRRRVGGALLLLSMTGALLFGAYYHFLLAGPDHVSSVHSQGWGVAFQLTAFLLAITEVFGASAAFRVLRAKT